MVDSQSANHHPKTLTDIRETERRVLVKAGLGDQRPTTGPIGRAKTMVIPPDVDATCWLSYSFAEMHSYFKTRSTDCPSKEGSQSETSLILQSDGCLKNAEGRRLQSCQRF